MVTGAGGGLGVDIVKAALASGHAVVATGRNTDAVERFGRIDVPVNDAGNFYAALRSIQARPPCVGPVGLIRSRVWSEGRVRGTAGIEARGASLEEVT
jgi:NAD(P)-dependent dehydrogenase (short-subunit alcohol dehydrogenase family)